MIRVKTGSKFGNITVPRPGGKPFGSKLEERRYYQLIHNPAVADVQCQVEYKLTDTIRKCTHCHELFEKAITTCPKCRKKLLVLRGISYLADFVITYKDGHIEVEDVKGHATDVFIIKRKLFEMRYRDLTLKIVTETEVKAARWHPAAKKVMDA